MRLPRGMTKRGRTFYWRTQADNRDKLVSLGQDYHDALRRFADIKTRGIPAPKVTVAVAVERWLETRVATGRNAYNLRKTRVRADRYLKRFMGHMLLSKVKSDTIALARC